MSEYKEQIGDFNPSESFVSDSNSGDSTNVIQQYETMPTITTARDDEDDSGREDSKSGDSYLIPKRVKVVRYRLKK